MQISSSTDRNSLPPFFLITFAFTWLIWSVPVLDSASRISSPGPNIVWIGIGAHGPLVASLILTYRTGGWGMTKRLLRAGFDLRMSAVWWLLLILIPLTLAGAAVWLSSLFHNYQPDLALLQQPVLILPLFLFMFFLGGSVQEEFGWRGYALPRLLEIQTPFLASLVLGLIWGVWHVPLFFMSGVSQEYMPFAAFLPLTIAFSFLFTWAYLRTGMNLFSALLLHTTINTSLNLFPTVELEAGGERSAMVYLLALFSSVALFVVIRERALFFTIWKHPSE
jgi:uncharacterized protein